MNKPFVPLLATLTFSACATDGPGHRGPVVRDSAGIRIVENTTPLWQEGEAWRLSPEPMVDIGDASAGEEYELFRASSAVRLSDGRIVIANDGSRELRFYGVDGTFLLSVGRQGDGPGEFQNLRWMRRMPGDSLVTYDDRQLRLSVFDSSGAFARTVRLQTTASVPYAFAIDMFADGSFLATGVNNQNEPPSGLQRYGRRLYHFAADGTLITESGTFGGRETYYDQFPDGRGFWAYEPFFPRQTYHRPAGDWLYLAANDSYELRRYTADGRLTDLVRRAHVSIAVTQGHLERERERRLAQSRSDDRRRTLSQVLNKIPVPETFPAYDGVAIDGELNVWVREFTIPGLDRATWSVFDSTGVLLGQLEAPLRFEPEDIGADYVLGVWRDADDVEHVRMYGLVKP